MTNKLAFLITNMFNAPWVCAYILIYLFIKYPNQLNLMTIIGVLLFLFILPWAPVLVYAVSRRMNPSKLSGLKRIPFVMIGLASYVIGSIFFYLMWPRTLISKFLTTMHIMYIIFSILIILGNMKSKPSIHVGGFTAPITLLSLFDNLLILFLLCLAPLIGWTRIKLKIHTINQLLLGFIIGFSSAILAYAISLLLF